MFTHTIEEISKVLTNLQTRLDAGDFFDVSNNVFFGSLIKPLFIVFCSAGLSLNCSTE
jgi:hypothetical protein